jgi:hypothetical protein
MPRYKRKSSVMYMNKGKLKNIKGDVTIRQNVDFSDDNSNEERTVD